MSHNVSSFPSLESLSHTAADLVVNLANEAIEARGIFTIALAGGSTPRGLYEALSSEAYKTQINWSAWHVYFGDDRLVASTDDQSNYAMACQSLLSRVPIKSANIYAPPVYLASADMIATEYERMIRGSFGKAEVPRLDLILLGLGSDGHTASLFPGKAALDVHDRLVTSSTPGVLPPPVDRITFTLPFINAARHIVFLAAGKDKVAAFRAACDGTPLEEVKQVPAGLVRPENGDVHWFVTDELSGGEG